MNDLLMMNREARKKINTTKAKIRMSARGRGKQRAE